MNEQFFNDLAQVSIYHFADVAYKKKAKAAANRLVEEGLIESLDDGETAYEQYEDMVVEYVQGLFFPHEFKLQYDFYGAKCISDHKGANAPKTSWYAGDSQGRIMFFDSFAALVEYTKDKLAELERERNV